VIIIASSKLTLRHFGNESLPLIVIDDFLPNPESILQLAMLANFEWKVRYYPGIQASFPFAKMQELIFPYISEIQEAFSIPVALKLRECGLAMVTKQPEELLPIQRVPHIDTTDPYRIAVLVYVSGTEFGGTAFFRHKKTGYESIGDSRKSNYWATLKNNIQTKGVPQAEYITKDTELFECIARVDPVPGRALIYRANALHSGVIQNAHNLSEDVRKGRLTVNAFLDAE